MAAICLTSGWFVLHFCCLFVLESSLGLSSQKPCDSCLFKWRVISTCSLWKVFSGLCSMWMNRFPSILFPITSNQKCKFEVDHEVSIVVVKVWYLHQCECWRNSNSSLSNFSQLRERDKWCVMPLKKTVEGYCSRWTSLMKPEKQQQRHWTGLWPARQFNSCKY